MEVNMRARAKKPRAPTVTEMDVAELAWTGAPPEDLPGILAAALVMYACEIDRVDVALPGEQAEAVASAIAAILAEGRATGRVGVRPHRLGWRRVTIDLAGPDPVLLTG
jgi:hypothetical protein